MLLITFGNTDILLYFTVSGQSTNIKFSKGVGLLSSYLIQLAFQGNVRIFVSINFYVWTKKRQEKVLVCIRKFV